MRRTSLVLLASILFTNLGAAPTSKPATTHPISLPNTIQIPRFHFEVRYPAGWERNKDDAPGTVSLAPPAPNPNDLMPCIVLCAYPLSDLPNVHTADDLRRHERDLIANSGGKITSERPGTLAGHPCYEFVFEIVDPQSHARIRVIDRAFINDRTVFGATLNGPPDQLEKFAPELQAILASFQTSTPSHQPSTQP